MKKLLGLFLLALACWVPDLAQAATCFWVGGTGNINDTTHWSNASGGSVSTCASAGGWPNANTEDATFDASSGGGTITRNVNWTIRTLTTSLFTGTFGNSTDTATVQLDTLANNGSGTRTYNMGASTWTCGRSGTAACNWNSNGATNLTFNKNTSTLAMSGSVVGTAQFASLGTFSYAAVTFTGETALGNLGTTWGGNTTIDTLTIDGANFFSINSATTITATNFVRTNGSASAYASFVSTTFGNNWQLTLTNAGTCNYCAFRDSTVNTTSITATNSINMGHLTNITVTAPSGGGGGGRIIGG